MPICFSYLYPLRNGNKKHEAIIVSRSAEKASTKDDSVKVQNLGMSLAGVESKTINILFMIVTIKGDF
jgi:hypothetical protein